MLAYIKSNLLSSKGRMELSNKLCSAVYGPGQTIMPSSLPEELKAIILFDEQNTFKAGNKYWSSLIFAVSTK